MSSRSLFLDQFIDLDESEILYSLCNFKAKFYNKTILNIIFYLHLSL